MQKAMTGKQGKQTPQTRQTIQGPHKIMSLRVRMLS
jgi:hypothetical protein